MWVRFQEQTEHFKKSPPVNFMTVLLSSFLWPFVFQNQVSREIVFTVKSLPWISIPTVSLFLLELRGYSKLYDDIGDFPNGEQIPGDPTWKLVGQHTCECSCAQKAKGYLKCHFQDYSLPSVFLFVCLFALISGPGPGTHLRRSRLAPNTQRSIHVCLPKCWDLGQYHLAKSRLSL